MSLIIFPASNLTGLSDLYIGWLALIFLSFFVIGYYILALEFLKKWCKWIDKKKLRMFKKNKKKKNKEEFVYG